MFRVLGVYNFGLGQEYKNIFVNFLFLVQIKTVAFAFENNWPLASLSHEKMVNTYKNECQEKFEVKTNFFCDKRNLSNIWTFL